MRRLALLLLFALPVFGYEVRSLHYALSVEIVGERYVLRITDLDAKTILVSGKADRKFGLTRTFEAGGRQFHVGFFERPERFRVQLSVQQKQKVLDSLHATWLMKPYEIQADTGKPHRVGWGVHAPVVLKRVDPEYTEMALRTRIAGVVALQVIVDRHGKATGAKVLESLPFGLDEKAIEAVKQWQFQPATKDGRPVDVYFNVVVKFELP